MARGGWRRLPVLVLVCIFATLGGIAYGARALPPEVVKAVAEAFPGATIRGVEKETENGVQFYELNLDYVGMELGVEVDKYGGFGEIERPISLEEAPEELAAVLLQLADPSPKDVEIERHERWGVAREGRFVPLDEPKVSYEIELSMQGREREVTWQPAKPVDLPGPATEAVKKLFPKAVITGAEKEQINGADCFKLSLILYGADLETRVTADGIVIEVSTPASMKSLPRPAADTLKRIAKGHRVKRINRIEVRASVQAEQIIPLEKASVFFAVRLEKGDTTSELKIAADGTLIKDDADDSRKRDIGKHDDQDGHF